MSIVDHKITEQQIADYGLNSLPDSLTGTVWENKTAMQKLLVLIGIPAINAAIDELALVEAQADDWAVAEAARAAAELLRAAAEEARATAEQGRASAESSRVTAESGRITAETGRVNAESARVSAESTRATNESSRQTAESGRATAESGRVSAETNRVSAESSRVSAESGRVREENLRVDAELQRVNTFAEQVEQANKSRVEAQTSAEAAELSEANARQHAEDALRSENSIQVFVGENPPTDGSKLIQIIEVEEPESFQAATIQEVNAAIEAARDVDQIETNDYPKKSAYVLVTQNDADSQGVIKESLRRVPVTKMRVMVDARDAKGYAVAFSVTADGYPALTFTAVEN